ncbi:basic amino acid/polyamine antiporter [Photobacterium sp. DNB23_23_1]|uniref:Basic amino acid/polyamine antiporter n=1 Tax=Photobacterium pectinilyticum TaxID=2906793 RepID=A0ABT1NBT5_9GAMM|nr:basic amino acid/polyamine antiporter [Photobacterium sp. ZSDE20]MCQ1061274.1 basic amino acid/polyamine antiporter [Photobacterium sp. ZSDE20]MDD1829754.1 basic amino acid/polyamine antiporter [Photobacterium sp. ZSDE20]
MQKKLGLGSLTALVIGSMIGAGVFSLPQNMAAVASPAAVIIGWTITGIGMIFLALAFQHLSRLKPEIESGVFGYAQAGFGDFVGFCSAWGYWLSAMLANVSYLVIVFSTLGMLFDTPDMILFGAGNTWLSVIGSSVLLWLVHALVLRGVQTAAMINMVTTCAKLIPLFLFIFSAFVAFQWDTFVFDFTGLHFGEQHDLLSQVKGTMLITVWVFIGIEGAVVVSNRAKNRKDIGRATILGLLTALTIYVFVTLLSMGVISTEQLATYQNPSMAKVLTEILGPWGKYIIGGGLLVSVCGAFLSWTVLASEAPYLGAKDKMFPICFSKQNQAGSPVNSLLLTNCCIQVSLIFVMFAGSTYDTLLAIASEMILVPYFLVGAYTLKLAIERKDRGSLFVVGLCASLYGLWLLYASGLGYLLLSALLYLPGLYFYIKAKREQQTRPFVGKEMTAASILTMAACLAVGMLWKGMI